MVNVHRRSLLLGITAVIGSGAIVFVFPRQHDAVDEKLPEWLDAKSKASAKKATRQSEQAVVEATLSGTRQHYERLRALDQDEAVSARKLQPARAQRQADKARVEDYRQGIRDIRNEILQHRGAVLSTWAPDDASKSFQGLLTQQNVLLLIILGPDLSLPDRTGKILVSRTGRISQEETYFFLSNSAQLRTGTRVSAWIPQTS